MMKHFILLISFLGVLYAQNPSVYQLQYSKGNSQMPGFGFDIEPCDKSAISDHWKQWIKSRNGKISILKDLMGNKQATEVQFNRQSFTVYFDVLDQENSDSLIVVNAFQLPTGLFVSENQNKELFDYFNSTIQDFSLETKKACIRNDLEQANKYQAKLNDQLVDLQRKKGREEKNILSNQNDILRWQSANRNLEDKIITLQGQIEGSATGKRQDKLVKRLNKSESTLLRNQGKMTDAENDIRESEQEIEILKQKIELKSQELNLQSELIETIKSRLSKISV